MCLTSTQNGTDEHATHQGACLGAGQSRWLQCCGVAISWGNAVGAIQTALQVPRQSLCALQRSVAGSSGHAAGPRPAAHCSCGCRHVLLRTTRGTRMQFVHALAAAQPWQACTSNPSSMSHMCTCGICLSLASTAALGTAEDSTCRCWLAKGSAFLPQSASMLAHRQRATPAAAPLAHCC
jgi:hypothetical protein